MILFSGQKNSISSNSFNLIKQFSSIWPIDRALLGATTPGLSGPWSDGNEEVLHIPRSSSITRTLPSTCLMSYQDTRWGGSYPSAEMQSMYSTALTNWAIHICK